MKIIHLSDTHVGKGDNADKLQRILDDVHRFCGPEGHLLLHTGDLNDTGKTEGMQASRILFDAMVDKGWQVLLAPGNHDYGDSLHIDPHWAENFRTTYARYIFGSQAPRFPVLTLTDYCALIGLDTNEAEMGFLERWMAEGFLGKRQIDALDALLDQAEVKQRKVVLYMHHHPFFDAFAVRPGRGDVGFYSQLFSWNTRRFRRLKDAYPLMQCIRDRVDVLLFGHQHFGLDYSAEGQRYGIALALDASSSTCTQMDTQRMRYRIIDTATGTFHTRFVP